MDLLVSHSLGRFARARREVRRFLREIGDDNPSVTRSPVAGIAVVRTVLDAREVIRRCRQRWAEGRGFQFAVKWVPVDYWCDTDLDSIRTLLAEQVRPRIGERETWGMKVKKRRWQKYHSIDIVRYLAAVIDRKVDLDRPDWLVRVEVLGSSTAVSLLRPNDIFSIGLPPP